jgi:hypothetical protein
VRQKTITNLNVINVFKTQLQGIEVGNNSKSDDDLPFSYGKNIALHFCNYTGVSSNTFDAGSFFLYSFQQGYSAILG